MTKMMTTPMAMPAMALGDRLPLESGSLLRVFGSVMLTAFVENTLPLSPRMLPSAGS